MKKRLFRQVLNKKELIVTEKLYSKLLNACIKDHKTGKCKIKDCRLNVDLRIGTIEHYSNGYYI